MSTVKNGRRFRLTIEMGDGTQAIVIENPFTLQFDVKRSSMATLNTATLSIYNLSEKTRNLIFQDRFINQKYRKVILEAGYDFLATIFVGSMFEASSARSGPDIITIIHARDGGFDTANTMTFQTLQAPTLGEIFKALIGDFPNLNQGKVGNFDTKLKRPAVLDGNTFDLIKKYSDNQVFVDLETVNILQDNEVIEGDIPLITAATGLLETPRRDDAYMTVTTIFEPRIMMGQVIELKSDILPQYDGQYKVIGVHHRGIISEAVGGELQTTLNLLLGSQLFGSLQTVE